MPAPVFYATVVPLIVYVVVKKGFVEPFLREERSKKLEKQKQNNFNKLLEKRKEAVAAQELMMATYDRIRDDESKKKGLLIIKAIYGKISKGEKKKQVFPLNIFIVSKITRIMQCGLKNNPLLTFESINCSSLNRKLKYLSDEVSQFPFNFF